MRTIFLLSPADTVIDLDELREFATVPIDAAGKELDYIPVATATRRGARPPKLAKLSP